MSYFVVIREAGPAWTEGKGAFEQSGVAGHGAFMEALAAEGFVLFGGPLAGSEQDRIRAMLIVDAANEAEIHRRLGDDPWTLAKRLVTVSAEPWNVFVGAPRLAAKH
jgi:uncharacterized protein YciI